ALCRPRPPRPAAPRAAPLRAALPIYLDRVCRATRAHQADRLADGRPRFEVGARECLVHNHPPAVLAGGEVATFEDSRANRVEPRSEEHTSELQSREKLGCRLRPERHI